ncbi:MAG TPA: energy transducer TonB [Steroidobacteraceae bacterium]|nr:energy transducer TonB [Steroidobacteraceae bacterium]
MDTTTAGIALAATLALAAPAAAQMLNYPDILRVEGAQAARFRLLSGDRPGKYYPPAARRKRIDGHVVVDLLLNDQGQVMEAQAVSVIPPGMGFRLAALDLAKTYQFANPLKRMVLMTILVEFLP